MPWLTPSDMTGVVYRTLAIPTPFLSQVSGALNSLAMEWNWEAYGDMTPAECAQEMSDMIDVYYEGNMFIGMVVPYVTEDIPTNCLLCDGTQYARVDYPGLYAVLASCYIDDADNFHVPDLVGRFVMGDDENVGDEGGEATHTLSVDEMPNHSHTIPYQSCFPYGEIPEICVTGGLLTQNTGSTGGGQAHNNLPPYHGMMVLVIAK
jgi:microcystin-dependent protein